MSKLANFFIALATALAILFVAGMVDQSVALKGFGPLVALFGGALCHNLLGVK